MNEKYTSKDLIRDKLLADEELKKVNAAEMISGIVEGVCPKCGAVIWVHVYETDTIQRINTACTAEGCDFGYDYYFFKE